MMSGYVRRAFSYRNMLWLRNSGVVRGCDVWSPIQMCDSNRVLTLPAAPNFVAESRRAFAKGRKSSTSLFLISAQVMVFLVTVCLGLSFVGLVYGGELNMDM